MSAAPAADEETGVGYARTVAFSDGVIAIAITLLVLNLDVPRLSGADLSRLDNELLDQWKQLLAYLLSFAVVGRFWLAHHFFCDSLRGFDARLMGLNLAFLGCLVLVPYTTEILGSYPDQRSSAFVYGGTLALAAACMMLMTQYALRAGWVRPSMREALHGERSRQARLFTTALVLSVPAALLSPYLAEAMWVGTLMLRWHGQPGE
jgi:uncharacterized membrane protein